MPCSRSVADERVEIGFRADLGIERFVVDDVVAVRAACARLEERRRVEVADAERSEIRDDRCARPRR